tara:strand:+ start:15231 stop:16130 length:900 start_codon:yes stop_codon:yes gene_type:complete
MFPYVFTALWTNFKKFHSRYSTLRKSTDYLDNLIGNYQIPADLLADKGLYASQDNSFFTALQAVPKKLFNQIAGVFKPLKVAREKRALRNTGDGFKSMFDGVATLANAPLTLLSGVITIPWSVARGEYLMDTIREAGSEALLGSAKLMTGLIHVFASVITLPVYVVRLVMGKVVSSRQTVDDMNRERREQVISQASAIVENQALSSYEKAKQLIPVTQRLHRINHDSTLRVRSESTRFPISDVEENVAYAKLMTHGLFKAGTFDESRLQAMLRAQCDYIDKSQPGGAYDPGQTSIALQA